MTERLDTGPPPSWEEFAVAHSARVQRLAYRLTGNRADAEDLSQDVFVRVFRSLDRLRPGTAEGWLHRMTTNLFLDQLRRRRRVRLDPVAAVYDHRLDRPVPQDAALVEGVFDDDVAAALAALAPDVRAAVVLRDLEGMSYEEIAVELGVSLATVRSRLHRGRAQLRRALAHRAPRGERDGVPGPGVDRASRR